MSETKKSPDESEADAPEAKASVATSPNQSPVKRTWVDRLMKGAILVGLGVLMTAPLWCTDDMTRNFGGPTTFRADREGEAGEGAQAQLTAILEEVIRKAAGDEMVEEDEVSGRMAAILEEEGLGDAESRRAESMKAIGDIVARAAEMDGSRGLSSLQEGAIAGQARMMARTLITGLGGTVEGATAEAPDGEWKNAAWPLLKGFEYEEGMNRPAPVQALDGADVKAWGYLVPLEENQYLLVQSLWSCCFGRPPDIHEAIVVRTRTDVSELENSGVQVYGRFEAGEAYEDGFVTSLYRLDAEHVLPL